MTYITEACLHATLEFPGSSEEDINCGSCFEWASLVFDLVEGSKIAGHNVRGHGHSWVEYEGLCYDAETPDGIADWRKLPFFKRLENA